MRVEIDQKTISQGSGMPNTFTPGPALNTVRAADGES